LLVRLYIINISIEKIHNGKNTDKVIIGTIFNVYV